MKGGVYRMLTVYQEKNGKIIPYVPALKKVSKTKRNNSLKM